MSERARRSRITVARENASGVPCRSGLATGTELNVPGSRACPAHRASCATRTMVVVAVSFRYHTFPASTVVDRSVLASRNIAGAGLDSRGSHDIRPAIALAKEIS